MEKYFRYIIAFVVLALVILVFFQKRHIEQLDTVVVSTQNEILNHYYPDGTEQLFDKAIKSPGSDSLEALYFFLYQQEGLTRALIELDESHITKKLGKNFMFDSEGSMIASAAPIALLNINQDHVIQSYEIEQIKKLKEVWSNFHRDTKITAYSKRTGKIDSVGLALSYTELVKSVEEIFTK